MYSPYIAYAIDIILLCLYLDIAATSGDVAAISVSRLSFLVSGVLEQQQLLLLVSFLNLRTKLSLFVL